MSAKVEDLLARVEKAEGPDRELDREIHMAVVGDMDHIVHSEAALWNAYTASIDAAVALVEKVMPGWSWRAGKRIDTFCANVATPTAGTFECRDAPSAPLALLAAMLRALPSPAQVEE